MRVNAHKDTLQKRVAVIQMSSKASVAENLITINRFVREAALNRANLVVLPENVAFVGKNEADKLSVAEEFGNGPLQSFFSKLAKELNIWLVGGTIPIKAENRVYASCLVWNNLGQNIARYDKIHLFDVVVPAADASDANNASNKSARSTGGLEYLESKTICPGNDCVTVQSPFGTLGLSVCYDLRFPELYRQLLKAGSQIFLIPSAFTAITGEAHWETLLRARAIENLSYVIAPNQVGIHANDRASFGHSMIIDPWGKILSVLSQGEGVIYADLDMEYLIEIRNAFPALEHRKFSI